MPKRIRLSRKKGFKLPRDAISVARPHRWGNPFRVGDKEPFGSKPMTPQMAVDEYRRLLQARPDIAANAKKELRGRSLACWCPLEDEDGNVFPCHADVLLALVNS